MIRIETLPRLSKTARRLGPEIQREAERRLTQLARAFGAPHEHSGLGLRKIGPRSYEVRLDQQWRLVLVRHGDVLLAHDILNHDGVRAWLKGQR
jgi:hypothetical protein